jgi:hypothetical protein
MQHAVRQRARALLSKSGFRDLLGTVALATTALALLLLSAARVTSPLPLVAEVGSVWTSFDPISREIAPGPSVWPIEEHKVTVTFRSQALTAPAWFTFTPQSAQALPFPFRAAPYFFDLRGTYSVNGQPVSLGAKGIEIELAYEEAAMVDIDPRTLQFFRPAGSTWAPRGGQLGLVTRTLTYSTDETGAFGVGGELRYSLFLPLIRSP